jgi:hypothetical protein
MTQRFLHSITVATFISPSKNPRRIQPIALENDDEKHEPAWEALASGNTKHWTKITE